MICCTLLEMPQERTGIQVNPIQLVGNGLEAFCPVPLVPRGEPLAP